MAEEIKPIPVPPLSAEIMELQGVLERSREQMRDACGHGILSERERREAQLMRILMESI